MWVRKALRPLIPDQLMARVRLAQHSHQVRANVEVVERDARQRRRWLARTPDTYRVIASGRPVPADWHLVGDTSAAVVAPGSRAVVAAFTAPPRLRNRRRTEPTLAVLGVSMARDVVAAHPWIGELVDPVAALEALRAIGEPYTLVPLAGTGGQRHRVDAIDAPLAVVVLALVPMHDIGGGSRGAQLARAFVASGAHVTYVALYGTQESTDLGLRYAHPMLEDRGAEEFAAATLLTRLAPDTRTLVILEAPHPAYAEVFTRLRSAGATTVYDLIDDWRAGSLGGEWYRPETERTIVAQASVLTASAADLVRRLERDTGRDVLLVPNAADLELFDRARTYERPRDLPEGDGPVLLYHGSLYGDWFDWEALREVALAHPQARVVVIGDDPATRPVQPANVTFLGLKPQVDLPAYLAHADVGLIPFVVDDVTHAVSPLKAYEYLAMGLPVAAPPLRALEGLAGVHCDRPLSSAVANARRSTRGDDAAGTEHAWSTRVASLLAAAGWPFEARGTQSPSVVVRSAEHHPRGSRTR